MARNVLPDQYYTFVPATRTITLNRPVKRESLLLITNVTTNTVIYNFSDPNLRATAYGTSSPTNPTGTGGLALGNATDAITTIVLNYNTSSMSSTDKLQVIVDEYESKFVPGETLIDPVGKFRVSMPQSLIDTDFEYAVQQTKWELLQLVNNRPTAFLNINSPITGRGQTTPTSFGGSGIVVSNGSRIVTVNLASSTGFTAGNMVYIQDSQWNPANGLFVIETVPGGTSFTYRAREAWYTGATPSTNIIDLDIPTQLFDAQYFTNSGFGGTITYSAPVGSRQDITCSLPHGLEPGNDVALVNNQPGSTTSSAYGNHIVYTITTPFVFSIYGDAALSGTPTASANTVYARPGGYSQHRAFDGGVTFSTNSNSHNIQYIRQTRRYFRYQSGKGIQVSTGTSLKTQLNIDALQSSGSTVTVFSKYAHGVYPGMTVIVGGAVETAYNGTFTVTERLDDYRFRYTAGSTPSASVASGNFFVTFGSYYGGTNRTGLYDSQNGFFFEFDGQRIAAVRRSSTYQIGGFVSVSAGDSTVSGLTVNGATTQFSKQLSPNDFIVLRGSTYRVHSITSDTSFKIIPAYRGTSNLTKGVVSKTVDLVYPQSSWNIDRCDGTGPSGFILDVGKMNMYYMDYTWYGAGFIRYGFRAADGNIVYVHKIVNNNVNTEAYMRSGNLPARYETNTISKYTTLAATLSTAATTMTVTSTAEFPSSGTVLVRNDTQCEYVNYTGKSSTTLTGLTRGQSGTTGLTFTATSGSITLTGASTTGLQVGQYVYTGTLGQIPHGAAIVSITPNTSITISKAATASGSITLQAAPLAQTDGTFNYSITAPTVVQLHAPAVSSQIAHWGTSVIMDGRFDDDKAFVFTYGQNALLSVAASATNVLMAIRVGPFVTNGNVSGTIGSRDLTNRMQLVLRALDINQTGTSGFLVTLILNGTPSANAAGGWLNPFTASSTTVAGSSLAQVATYTSATTITGGEVVGGFYTNPGANTATTLDLSAVRDLGNSIQGGGGTSTLTGIYPDGPDVIHVVVRNLNGGAAQTIAGRLSWTEAQA
jgi:hypothetical protein